MADKYALQSPFTYKQKPIPSEDMNTKFRYVITAINDSLANYSGATAPSLPQTGMLWNDTGSTPSVLKKYDGSQWNDIRLPAAEILARLITVDGSGSGLDADFLDGQHAEDFVLIPTTSIFPVRSVVLCRYGPSTVLSDGSTTSGSNINPILAYTDSGGGGALWNSGKTQTGTWKNISGIRLSYTIKPNVGYFVRIA